MDIINKDLPQLIVGLDSLDDSANYIHIEDAKENTNYYCPCCKGLIRPRAYKKDIDYQVQPHFYHETGGCSDETYIHYICKNWLFEKGCKFIVRNTEYKVDYIEVEKTLHTSFGNYRPDIIVTTSIGKVFYFEIRTTNRKSILYAPKWDELGNDVVEVDTRYFINQKYKNNVPEFNLIYSDGHCYIKSYSRTDYEDTIGRRKLEWKRQDKLNYKIQWERLDWFYIHLRNYIANQEVFEDLKEAFCNLEYSDKVWVYENIKNKSCTNMKSCFSEIINIEFIEWLKLLKNQFKDEKFSAYYLQHSKTIYYFYVDYYEEGYKTNVFSRRFRSKCGIWIKETIDDIYSICNKNSKYLHDKLYQIHELERIPYVKRISPTYDYAKTRYEIDNIYFNIVFQGNLYNKYIKSYIGTDSWVRLNKITSDYLYSNYLYFLEQSRNNFLNNELYKLVLKSDKKFTENIKIIQEKCNSLKGFSLSISYDLQEIKLYYHSNCLMEWYFYDEYLFGQFENDFLALFYKTIEEKILTLKLSRNFKAKITKTINFYANQINKCKNGYWTFRMDYRKRWIISLFGYEMYFEPNYDSFPKDNLDEYTKQKVTESMNILVEKLKNGVQFNNNHDKFIYPDLRIMEVK